MAQVKSADDRALEISSVNGTSMALNTQKGFGGHKPSPKGNSNPGGTNPGRETDGSVPIA